MGLMDRIKEEASSTFASVTDTSSGQPQQQMQPQMQQPPQQQAQYRPLPRIPRYIVLQVTLKEKFIGTGSGNLGQLEAVINNQCQQGYRLHTISTASANSGGLMGGDRIQATLVFEQIV